MRKSIRFHKRFIHRDLNSWKGPASKRDLLHPKDHANRRWTIHRAEYVQDKTRLDKSNRRYCFYTSNSFLHVGTAHFSFDEMRTQTSGIQERSKDRNRSIVIGLKINSYRQDFPFIFLLIFGFRFQIKSSCSLKSPLESSASVPTLTHLSGVNPHSGSNLFCREKWVHACRSSSHSEHLITEPDSIYYLWIIIESIFFFKS